MRNGFVRRLVAVQKTFYGYGDRASVTPMERGRKRSRSAMRPEPIRRKTKQTKEKNVFG